MPARHPLNPYPPLSSIGRVRRMMVSIPEDDARLIESVCPTAGIVAAITLNVIKHLVDELKRTNTTSYDPDAIVTYIRRLADIRITGEGRPVDEPRGTSSVRSKAPKRAKQPTPTSKPGTRSTRASKASGSASAVQCASADGRPSKAMMI